ncbi:MAG: hypothetical protein JOZ93_13420, partial [Sinobacteraceae bacterium]|nr:hypothetical protein [Nevskiaceae bacterium]
MRPEITVSDAAPVAPGSFLTRTLRARLLGRLDGLRGGYLRIEEPGGVVELGEQTAGLRATIVVRDRGFYRALAIRGSVGAAEAYMDG